MWEGGPQDWRAAQGVVEVAWETMVQFVNKLAGPEILACPGQCGGDIGNM